MFAQISCFVQSKETQIYYDAGYHRIWYIKKKYNLIKLLQGCIFKNDQTKKNKLYLIVTKKVAAISMNPEGIGSNKLEKNEHEE